MTILRSCPNCFSFDTLDLNFVLGNGQQSTSHFRNNLYNLAMCKACSMVYYKTAPDEKEMKKNVSR